MQLFYTELYHLLYTQYNSSLCSQRLVVELWNVIVPLCIKLQYSSVLEKGCRTPASEI